jgi:hypothetical protein
LKEKKHSSSNEGESGLFLLTNKSKVWSYENEFRLILDTDHTTIDNSHIKMSDDNLFLYWDIDLSFISKIVFGINAKPINMQKTHDLFLEHKLSPKYEKMNIDPIDLKLSSQEYIFK